MDKPLTLLYSDGSVPEVDMKAAHEQAAGGRPVVTLDPEVAQYHIERVQVLDSETWGMLVIVFPFLAEREQSASHADMIRAEGNGVRNIAGFIDMSLKLMQTRPGIAIVWRGPETGLHPKAQANLGDVVIRLTRQV